MLKYIPNFLTTLRIIFVPVLVITVYLQFNITSYLKLFIFLFAGCTDIFDGFIARACKTKSTLGQILDPIADKLLNISTLVILLSQYQIPIEATIIIICREILISGFREFCSLFRAKTNLSVSKLSKIKTASQIIAIVILILDDQILTENNFIIKFFIQNIGLIFLWISTILTIITGLSYLKQIPKHL